MAFFVFVLFCITVSRSAIRRVVHGAAQRPLICSPTIEDRIYTYLQTLRVVILNNDAGVKSVYKIMVALYRSSNFWVTRIL